MLEKTLKCWRNRNIFKNRNVGEIEIFKKYINVGEIEIFLKNGNKEIQIEKLINK